MIRLTGRLTLAALLAAAIALAPGTVPAQTNSTATTNAAAKPAKPRPLTFTGKLVSIDTTNKTFTVGPQVKHVYQVTSATKLMKTGKPAAFDDYVVGDQIRVGYGQTTDGKFEAKVISTVPPPPAKKLGATNPGPAAPASAAPPTAPKQP